MKNKELKKLVSDLVEELNLVGLDLRNKVISLLNEKSIQLTDDLSKIVDEACKEKPLDLVKRLRNSPELVNLKGEKLFEPLMQAVDKETNGKASLPPYCTWIGKCCGRKPPRSAEMTKILGKEEENDKLALKMRAYPSIESDLRLIDEWCAFAKNFWVAAAKQIQDTIRDKNWPHLKEITQKTTVEAYWNLLASRGKPVPVEIQRDCINRFMMACSKGKASKDKDTGLPDNKGYPSASFPPEEVSILVKFNGNNLMGASADLSNSYIKIGEPSCPPNHTPRSGKYRSKRSLRKVSIRLNSKLPWFEFDVLFRDSDQGLPFEGFSKEVRILRETFNGKHVWHIALAIEKSKAFSPNPRTGFAAADWNCRQNREDSASKEILDVGFIDSKGVVQKKSFSYKLLDNRRTRRQLAGISKGMEDMPRFNTTSDGIKEMKRTIDKRKDVLKQKYSLNQFCGWKSIRAIAELGSKAKSAPENLSNEDILFFKAEITWYDKAMNEYRFACRVQTERKKEEYFRIARESGKYLLENSCTDIASPDDDIKGMAEEKGKTKQKRKKAKENGEEFKESPTHVAHMCNVRNANRHEMSIGELRRICEWVWNKMGLCVHRVNPWRTSQRCPHCRTDTKSNDKKFTCSGCGSRIDRSDVAIFNGVELVKECCKTDEHPHLCSKDGDKKPYVALSGFDAWLADKAKQKEAAKIARQEKKLKIQSTQSSGELTTTV